MTGVMRTTLTTIVAIAAMQRAARRRDEQRVVDRLGDVVEGVADGQDGVEPGRREREQEHADERDSMYAVKTMNSRLKPISRLDFRRRMSSGWFAISAGASVDHAHARIHRWARRWIRWYARTETATMISRTVAIASAWAG